MGYMELGLLRMGLRAPLMIATLCRFFGMTWLPSFTMRL